MKKPAIASCALLSTAALFSGPPALAQTDHFKCYVSTELTLEQPVPVSLSDQFGDRPDAQALNAVWFCNPVSKDAEPILEPENHLTLYPIAIKNPEPARRVIVRNQFGTQDLVVTAPRLLAVPTLKRVSETPTGVNGVPVPISHFVCYEARDAARHEPVTLLDQFHTEEATVLSSTYFCNPATKTHGEVVVPPEPDEQHLTCYKITPSEQPEADFVDIENQIDGEDTLRIGPSEYLCLPTEKVAVGPVPPAPPELPE